ncbi:MAG: YlbF family regulator [Limisphaerales bacterium]
MTTLPPTIQAKLEDLCRSILLEPHFEAMRLQVDQFMINDEARNQYAKVSEQGEHLHHKQMQGVQLADEEVSTFEKERESLLKNPVARGFLDAQESFQGLQESVNKFVLKTLELGRIPQSADMEGGCGSGCGCH